MSQIIVAKNRNGIVLAAETVAFSSTRRDTRFRSTSRGSFLSPLMVPWWLRERRKGWKWGWR
jgi:hypothetical protein